MPLPDAWSLETLNEAGSTNDVARDRVRAGLSRFPYAVRALKQTAGRGRGARKWWSDAGSLLFTAAFDPALLALDLAARPLVSLAAAVAVVETLSPWAPAAGLGIRWPNDVESASGKKLAGILPEIIETEFGTRLLVGIGVNIRTRFEGAPDDVLALAGSLDRFTDQPIGPSQQEAIYHELLHRLAHALHLLAGAQDQLAEAWTELDLLRTRDIRADLGGAIVAGRCLGIGRDGGLAVLTNSGDLRILRGGTILRDLPTPQVQRGSAE